MKRIHLGARFSVGRLDVALALRRLALPGFLGLVGLLISGGTTMAQPYFYDFSSTAGLTIDSGTPDHMVLPGPVFGRTNVYFGGIIPDSQTYGGRSVSFVAPMVQRFDLTQGPVVVEGSFYNSNTTEPRNESYVWFGPDTTTLLNPIAGYNSPGDSFLAEGLRFGGNETQSIVVDEGTSSQPASVLASVAGHPVGQWYQMGAKLELVAGNIVLTPFINSTTFPSTVIGLASNYPWITNMRTGIGVDDYADEFQAFTVPEPAGACLVLVSSLLALCRRPLRSRVAFSG